ncbi:MAG: cysteine hydrolase [Telmatospirillum sp.]|nr:cysteine hydrolase [Telmatospirillum sp.]
MSLKDTALIMVGYQNDYFAKDGILRGVVEEPGRVDSVLAATVDLLTRLSKTEITIVSTPIVLKPDYRALASPVGILNAIKESGAFAVGSKGAQVVPAIKPFEDRIITLSGKIGFNGFVNTELDEILKQRGIKNVWLAGMVTSLCIDSTGRAAYERGYNVSVLKDCTSARTAVEQDFFCTTVFPLYGSVIVGSELKIAA